MFPMPLLSVIIPTLNEAESLPETLARTRQALTPGDEIIVTDGGSDDGTPEIAKAAGAQVVAAPRGRGTQMNTGVWVARGDVLLFLHADTHLPPDAGAQIRRALEQPLVLGGNFHLKFDKPDLMARLFAHVYNARSRRQRIFYGDSAVWVRRAVFTALGGFPPSRLMEDYAFCLALRAEAGSRHPDQPLSQTLPLLPGPVVTSARRFQGKRGLALKMLGVWSVLHVLYACGASPDALERWFYPPSRASGAR